MVETIVDTNAQMQYLLLNSKQTYNNLIYESFIEMIVLLPKQTIYKYVSRISVCHQRHIALNIQL